MTGRLLDTNILSEVRRPKANSRVLDFVKRYDAGSYYVAAITFVELRYGIERLRDLEQRASLRLWLAV